MAVAPELLLELPTELLVVAALDEEAAVVLATSTSLNSFTSFVSLTSLVSTRSVEVALLSAVDWAPKLAAADVDWAAAALEDDTSLVDCLAAEALLAEKLLEDWAPADWSLAEEAA